MSGQIDEFALSVNVATFNAAKEFCRALGWGFIATTGRAQTPDDLLARQVDDRVERILRAHLDAGPTDWRRRTPSERS